MNIHVKYATSILVMCGVVYLIYPPTPTLDHATYSESPQQYALRYDLAQAEAFLYETKFIGQRWRGLNRLDAIIEEGDTFEKEQALTAKFKYYRYHGQREDRWLHKSWHEPLPRDYVEKASEAALKLNDIAPKKAAELLSAFIIYPVTVPAIPDEAVDIVRDAAESDVPEAVKAMHVYCTDDRFWHPCSKEETRKWVNKDSSAIKNSPTENE